MKQTMSSDGKNPLREPKQHLAPPPQTSTFEVRMLVSVPDGKLLTPGTVSHRIQECIENELPDTHVRALSCQEAEVCDVCGCLTALHTHPCLVAYGSITEGTVGELHCVHCGGTKRDWLSRCPECFKKGLVS